MDIRVKKRAEEVRKILTLRMELMEKHIGAEKMYEALSKLKNMSDTDVLKIRNTRHDIADTILRVK